MKIIHAADERHYDSDGFYRRRHVEVELTTPVVLDTDEVVAIEIQWTDDDPPYICGRGWPLTRKGTRDGRAGFRTTISRERLARSAEISIQVTDDVAPFGEVWMTGDELIGKLVR